jgi:hypothetical protein
MKSIGNGPELMADTVTEFTARGHFACENTLTSTFFLTNGHGKNIVLSEASDHYCINA